MIQELKNRISCFSSGLNSIKTAGISVDLERLCSYSKSTLRRSDFRLLRLNVGQIRNYINDGLDVVADPIDGNEAHLLSQEILQKENKNN